MSDATRILPVELTRSFPKGAGEPPDIRALSAWCQSSTAEARQIWEEMDDLRNGEYEVEVPGGLEKDVVRTTLANANVTRAVATLMDQGVRISIPHNQDDFRGTGRDDRLEAAIQTVFWQLRRQKGQDVDSKFVEAVAHYGQAGMKLVYAPQLWRDRPKRERGEGDAAYNDRVEEWVRQQRRLPLNWSWVSPLEATPIWREDRLVAVLQENERTADTIYWQGFNGKPTQEWIDAVSRDEHGGAGRRLTVQEYWTEDTVTYAIDGETVSHQRHRYGRVPYVWAYGLSPATRDPKYLGQPMLWDMRGLIPYLDRLLTQKSSAIRQYAWPTAVVQPGPFSVNQDSGQWTREIELDAGGTVQLLPGEALSFLQWPGSGPDIDAQIRLVMGMLQTVGISDPAMGVGEGQSGYAISQLIQATRMKFGPIQRHCEAAFEELIQLLLDIVENLMPWPLYAYPDGDTSLLRLGPQDIRGQRQVRVKLTPTLPTDRYANSSRVIAEYRSGLLSEREAMDQLGVEDPQAMQLERTWDELKHRPPFQQAIEEMALQAFGIEMQKQQKQQGQGAMTDENALQQLVQYAQQNPALAQALMVQALHSGQQPGAGMPGITAPTPGAGIQAAPGMPAIPTPPAPSRGGLGILGDMGGAGLYPRPQGVGTGRAPGVKQQGVEEGIER